MSPGDKDKPTLPANREELELQTEDLARQMLDAMDRYDDPDAVRAREASEREQARRTADSLTRFYLETGQRESGDSLAVSIGKMARFFAERIVRELPAAGTFAPMTQPLPPLDSGTRLELAFAPASTLELRVTSGKQTTAKVLASTVAEAVGVLQSPDVGEQIIALAE